MSGSGRNLALLADLYQLNMLYGHWQAGTLHRRATFELFFRKSPGGPLVAAGLQSVVEYLENLRFGPEELDYLRRELCYAPAFLHELAQLRIGVDLDAVPEGTPVFPREPVVRVTGPLGQVQLIETALLNLMGHQSLIATKAARVVQAAGGGAVLEFGARRAHGPDAAVLGARAAVIAGCAATSNVLTGQWTGIPVAGTMSHAWVQSFPSELEAFRAFARAFPDNALLLVDTYDTLHSGVPNAIVVGQELQLQGKRLLGIRLDSGDLAELSAAARAMLDAAGFSDAVITASSDLDEYTIADLRARGARIDTWGVGTQLITGGDHPSLGGVYKLVAVAEDATADQHPRIKVSEDPAKVTVPGIKQLWRLYHPASGTAVADVQALVHEDIPALASGGYLRGYTLTGQALAVSGTAKPLLQPVLRGGALTAPLPSWQQSQAEHRRQAEALPAGCRRLESPEPYPLLLTPALWQLREDLLAAVRHG